MNYQVLLLDLFIPSIPVLGMLLLYHFLFWLPEKRAADTSTALLTKIQPGDVIQTKSGIVGFVIEKTNDDLIIKSCNSTFKIKNWAVAEKLCL
jgi:preprotein translocase YajC subunit